MARGKRALHPDSRDASDLRIHFKTKRTLWFPHVGYWRAKEGVNTVHKSSIETEPNCTTELYWSREAGVELNLTINQAQNSSSFPRRASKAFARNYEGFSLKQRADQRASADYQLSRHARNWVLINTAKALGIVSNNMAPELNMASAHELFCSVIGLFYVQARLDVEAEVKVCRWVR